MRGQWMAIPGDDGDVFRGYLSLPAQGSGEAKCPHTGERYILNGSVCSLAS